jgi:hypothetical protein
LDRLTFLPAFVTSAFKTSALLCCASPLSSFTDGAKKTLGKKSVFLIALRGLLILVFFLGEADRWEGRLGGWPIPRSPERSERHWPDHRAWVPTQGDEFRSGTARTVPEDHGGAQSLSPGS